MKSALPVLLVSLVSAWLPADASERPAVADGRSPIVVSLADSGDRTVRLEGRFTIAASRAVAWSVLTDYDHIQQFVSSMRFSRVKSRGDGFLLVEQESVGKVLFFQRTFNVLLKVREEPNQSVAFEDVSKTSFERYEGSWSLKDAAGGIEVIYRLTAKGGFMASGFVMRGASRKMVGELLDQVRAEMSRKSGAEGKPRP
ncbi:MAG TPA: SRPBCC family protein [Thermoanaerobaculia bacterium]|nr:SRPBCC family protein [Thermoanaerobaculia bacterium]